LSLPIAFTYSQLKVELDCNLNLESILKVHDLKIRYEAVEYIYNAREKNSKFIFFKNSSSLNRLFELINGFPMESKKQQDSISKVNPGELVEAEWMSEKEMDRYIEQLNCTPEQALNEYKLLIRNIKFGKEIYLKCIDAELAKGDLSEYSKEFISLYDFLPPGWSLTPLPAKLSKSDFLKVFKEFVLNDNDEVLPDGVNVYAYLKCGCKIP
jgi:hypothetical protein